MKNPVLKYLLTSLCSLGVFALDQATKIYVYTQIPLGEPKIIIKGFFNIAYVTNKGGAFGLFSSSPDFIRFILFLLFPLVCLVFIFMMLREANNRFQVLALAFILGGAFGNYADRLRLGYVVDFIDWHVKAWHWPTFNLADSFIIVGVLILAFFLFKEWQQEKSKDKS